MSKRKKFKNILVMIDGENIGPSENLRTVLKNIEQTGKKVVIRIYGDWIASGISTWAKEAREFNMDTVNQTNLVSGKSLCDMRMIIDTVDAIHENDFDTFIIVSADSDFEPLCNKLHEKDKTVIIMSDRPSIVPKYASSGDYYVDLKYGACLKPKQLKNKKEKNVFNFLSTTTQTVNYIDEEKALFEKAKKAYDSALKKTLKKKKQKKNDGFIPLTYFAEAFNALGGQQGYKNLGYSSLLKYLKKYPNFYETQGTGADVKVKIISHGSSIDSKQSISPVAST